jgi:hypothetical protein
MTKHHVVVKPAAEYRRENYGIEWESVFVYRTAAYSSPTRIVVWDNAKRPAESWLDGRFLADAQAAWDRCQGKPAQEWAEKKWGQRPPATGWFVDPSNEVVPNRYTVLLSPEATVIDAYGTGTGTRGSGQLWAHDENGRDEVIRDGDEIELVYFTPTPADPMIGAGNLRFESFVAVLPRHNNGHGSLRPAVAA